MLQLSYVNYLPLLWMSALGQIFMLYDRWKVFVTQQTFGFASILIGLHYRDGERVASRVYRHSLSPQEESKNGGRSV